MEQAYNDKWEFYKDVEDKWRWRRTSPNGNIVGASTEGYINKGDCEANAGRNGWNIAVEEDDDELPQEYVAEEDNAVKSKAYDLYMAHGSQEDADRAHRINAERLQEERSRTITTGKIKTILWVLAALLCVIIAILLVGLLRDRPPVMLSGLETNQPSVVVLALNPLEDEKTVAFGDTYFEYDRHTLSAEAKTLLAGNVQALKDNPKIHVRLAGYTSAKGTDKVNQALSEKRANAVRNYLIAEGIAPERISVIGYGRTRPARFEVTPANKESREALANMRVLFEVVVQ